VIAGVARNWQAQPTRFDPAHPDGRPAAPAPLHLGVAP